MWQKTLAPISWNGGALLGTYGPEPHIQLGGGLLCLLTRLCLVGNFYLRLFVFTYPLLHRS